MQTAGKISHREGDFIVSENYMVHSEIDGFFGGVSYDASASFSDTISEAVAPFNTHEAERFKKPYLSGFYADVTDVPPYVYGDAAQRYAKSYFGA